MAMEKKKMKKKKKKSNNSHHHNNDDSNNKKYWALDVTFSLTLYIYINRFNTTYLPAC